MRRLRLTVENMWDRIFGGASAPPIVHSVTKDGLSYLGRVALTDLFRQVKRVEDERVAGVLLEAGCALGGSAIVIASAKTRDRPFCVYDVFGMIPPPSEEDGGDVHARYEAILAGKAKGLGDQPYYGYQDRLYGEVIANFARYQLPIQEHNISLVKGLFQETLYVTQPVALAHIDSDWYDSVKVCLERIVPCLSANGVLVIDDYYHWSGCRKAVDDYFCDKRDDYHFQHRSRLHILRK